MSKGTVHQTRQQHGWDAICLPTAIPNTRTYNDYHAYISKLSRIPSALHGAPQYPSVRKAFNNMRNPTKSPKKVQVTEQVQIIEQNGNQKSEVIEETVDDEADGFIQQKHKGFELCKWKTFNLP
ncbi:hypothetical protein Peur_032283 [Populus x canadensis]